MEEKISKEKIKEKILEAIDIENRHLSIRELTIILKRNYKIIRSEPVIKRYLQELVEEGEIYEE